MRRVASAISSANAIAPLTATPLTLSFNESFDVIAFDAANRDTGYLYAVVVHTAAKFLYTFYAELRREILLVSVNSNGPMPM